MKSKQPSNEYVRDLRSFIVAAIDGKMLFPKRVVPTFMNVVMNIVKCEQARDRTIQARPLEEWYLR